MIYSAVLSHPFAINLQSIAHYVPPFHAGMHTTRNTQTALRITALCRPGKGPPKIWATGVVRGVVFVFAPAPAAIDLEMGH